MGAIKNLVALWATLTKKAAVAFFDINQSDTILERGVKVGWLATKRTLYAAADYWLMAASAAYIIVIDQTLGYGWLGLFMLMWGFDIVVACVFVAIWQRTGEDITLGDSYRRATDAIHGESRIAGIVAFTAVSIKAAFWDGPEHIVIFFRKELKTELNMLVVLLVLSAIQAAIWTPIYVLGFETVSELFQYLWNLF